jgi:hypothetical protein
MLINWEEIDGCHIIQGLPYLLAIQLGCSNSSDGFLGASCVLDLAYNLSRPNLFA